MTSAARRGVDAFLGALLTRDHAVLSAIVAELRDQGTPVAEIYTDLFAPALRRVGDMWARGEISVASEHVATSLIEQLMGSLYRELLVTPRAARERVIVAAPAGERHIIGLRMAADILAGEGFDVVFLGGDTPREEFPGVIDRYEPRVIVLAAYLPETCMELAAAARDVLTSFPGLTVIAGGATGVGSGSVREPAHVVRLASIGELPTAVERAVAELRRP